MAWKNEAQRHKLSAMGIQTVDIDRFKGNWYDVASLQDGCSKGKTQYTPTGNKLKVMRTCVTAQGRKKTKEGTAIPNKKYTIFTVGYGWFGKKTNQVIHYIDKNYKYAIIGSEDKSSLYILSRLPWIKKDQYAKMTNIANKEGYDISKLIKR